MYVLANTNIYSYYITSFSYAFRKTKSNKYNQCHNFALRIMTLQKYFNVNKGLWQHRCEDRIAELMKRDQHKTHMTTK